MREFILSLSNLGKTGLDSEDCLLEGESTMATSVKIYLRLERLTEMFC